MRIVSLVPAGTEIACALGAGDDLVAVTHDCDYPPAAGAPRPTVVCLEWLAPLFNAGHWVPEQVAIAGGEDLLGKPLVPSIDFPWERLREADPEYLFLLPCGFDAERALHEARVLTDRPDWSDLRAVREGRTWVLDGNAYFSRPGPRVVDGIELLGSLLHPDRVPTPAGTRSIHLPTMAGALQRPIA